MAFLAYCWDRPLSFANVDSLTCNLRWRIPRTSCSAVGPFSFSSSRIEMNFSVITMNLKIKLRKQKKTRVIHCCRHCCCNYRHRCLFFFDNSYRDDDSAPMSRPNMSRNMSGSRKMRNDDSLRIAKVRINENKCTRIWTKHSLPRSSLRSNSLDF